MNRKGGGGQVEQYLQIKILSVRHRVTRSITGPAWAMEAPLLKQLANQLSLCGIHFLNYNGTVLFCLIISAVALQHTHTQCYVYGVRHVQCPLMLHSL